MLVFNVKFMISNYPLSLCYLESETFEINKNTDNSQIYFVMIKKTTGVEMPLKLLPGNLMESLEHQGKNNLMLYGYTCQKLVFTICLSRILVNCLLNSNS